jgi:SAM-dependent methyltransferase
MPLKPFAKMLLRRVPLARRVKRRLRPVAAPAADDPTFPARKAAKLARVRPLLRTDLPCVETPGFFDFLSADLRKQFHITDTDNVSANEYGEDSIDLIAAYPDGMILDCGAGLRNVYYDNVVNFEICSYPTTDVRGVGERLPFRDGVFDAVFSLNVLEHVRDPFACAKEIVRVLKPGGKLFAVVPFLQPLHGYPQHYFNMTGEGLRSLFEDSGMAIDKQAVLPSGTPIWTLTWFLRSWAAALPAAARKEFLDQKVGDLLGDARDHFARPFVRDLPTATNFELASTTALYARKKA